MTATTGAGFLVECLEAEGVERVYGIPGEETTELLGRLSESSVSFVPVRHEQGAAFIAGVHGRLTGEAGVCLGTLGPGATNLLTGVADAQLNNCPLVAITGQERRAHHRKESHQTIDVVSMFAPVTKWNAPLDDPTVIAEAVRKAFAVATREKPGATHLELPEDVATERTEHAPLDPRDPVTRPDPNHEAIANAAVRLERADRPIVLAGYGVIRTGATEALRAFVEDTGLPVVSTYMGKGALSDRDERSLLTIDSSAADDAPTPIERADCVLAVGYDVVEHDPAEWNPAADTDIIHMDVEDAEIYREYNPTIEVVGNLGAALEMLTGSVTLEAAAVWWQDEREALMEAVERTPDHDEPFSVTGSVPHLRAALEDDDVLVVDVGHHKSVLSQRFPTYTPDTFVVSNGLASMGVAIPGAIGADLAVESNVVAATGDGGFLMNAAELETASRLGCSFTVVVFDDEGFGSIRRKQQRTVETDYGTGVTNPDFVEFAESFGVNAYRPDDWNAFASLLERTVPSDELALVAVPLGEQ